MNADMIKKTSDSWMALQSIIATPERMQFSMNAARQEPDDAKLLKTLVNERGVAI